MKKLEIVTYPEKILSFRASEAVSGIKTTRLIPLMIRAMYNHDGIGLAAPQIGISERIIIVETSPDPRSRKQERKSGALGDPVAFLNPVIRKKSTETTVQEEGCLSLPGIFVPVKRSESIVIVCQTPQGEDVRIEAAGLIARIFQHEVDHLDGKLIIDRITPFKRLQLRTQLDGFSKK